jgi:AraC-like DNA-binding protein
MLFRSHIPSPPLSEFVDRFWFCSDNPPHARERILPSGTVELVINLVDDEIRIDATSSTDRCRRFSGAVVSGPYSQFFSIDPRQHAAIIGVHFKPGGAFPILGLPIDDLTDTHVDLESLWGRFAFELRERLCEATTPLQRFALLEAALLSRLWNSSRHHHHPAVAIALDAFEREWTDVSIRDVARRVDLSQRRFIQLFADEVGLTPKLYSRIQRFQRTRDIVQKLAAPRWAELAAGCGYADQSHLIRDFQEFSGLSPSTYLRQRSESVLLNHVPG